MVLHSQLPCCKTFATWGNYLKSLRETEQARRVAKLEAVGLSPQDNPYVSVNEGRFPQAGSNLSVATFRLLYSANGGLHSGAGPFLEAVSCR